MTCQTVTLAIRWLDVREKSTNKVFIHVQEVGAVVRARFQDDRRLPEVAL